MGWIDANLFQQKEQTFIIRIQVGRLSIAKIRHQLGIFRQKTVVELLEKNYRIHCSVHNKVIRKKSL